MSLLLNSGFKIPICGLGTWQSPKDKTGTAVKTAIKLGYRHIDCAYVYCNEAEIGTALTDVLTSQTVQREDLFITSKLWNTFHRPDLVKLGFQKSLDALNLKYLDMFLVHWPCGYEESDELFPKNADGSVRYSDVDYVETWKEVEKLVDEGLVRSIGVSNFNISQLKRILESCRIKPSMNQVEMNPNFPNKKLAEFCETHDIRMTAYAPLGSPDRPSAHTNPPLLTDPQVIAIADNHKKTPAQVLIRYVIQRKIAVIPKSVTPSRIQENFEVFDFELTSEEMHILHNFNRNFRSVAPVLMKDHKHFPFQEEEN